MPYRRTPRRSCESRYPPPADNNNWPGPADSSAALRASAESACAAHDPGGFRTSPPLSETARGKDKILSNGKTAEAPKHRFRRSRRELLP